MLVAGKSYEREAALYEFLGVLEKSASQALMDLVRELRKSLWAVLHVAVKPPGNEQEEFVRPSALADLARGNTFHYCILELEKFAFEHPLAASSLRILERIENIKALSS